MRADDCQPTFVGLLLAGRFRGARVVCVDLARRGAFDAFLGAFAARGGGAILSGEHRGDNGGLAARVEMRACDVRALAASELGPRACVVAVHACNDANRLALALARRARCAWAVVPCCVPAHLAPCSLEVRDDAQRHALLCGALAREFDARLVRAIDCRITARAIVVAGEAASERALASRLGTAATRMLKLLPVLALLALPQVAAARAARGKLLAG